MKRTNSGGLPFWWWAGTMREECKSPTPGWTLSPARKAPDDEVGRLRDELAASRREMRDEVERLTLELVECRMGLATAEYDKEQARASARRAEREAEELREAVAAAAAAKADLAAGAADLERVTSELVAARLELATREFDHEARLAAARESHAAALESHAAALADAQARVAELSLPASPATSPSPASGRTFLGRLRFASTASAAAAPAPRAGAPALSLRELIARVPLFASLTAPERDALAESCLPATFGRGEVISRTGEFADHMSLIAAGAVRVCVREAEVAALEAGSYFGEDSLMNDAPRAATVVAACDVATYCVPRRAVRDVLASYAAAPPERRAASWAAYASYESGLLRKLAADVATARTQAEYMAMLNRHRSSVQIIPLEPTAKLLNTSRDFSRAQFLKDLRRESAVVLDGVSYPTASSVHFDRFLDALRGIAEAAAAAPRRAEALRLPPSLVGFLPLLFAADADAPRPPDGSRGGARPAEAAVDDVFLQLLMAASRTTSGGDSFARCHELFGNSDVVVLSPVPELTGATRVRAVRPGLVVVTSANVYRIQHLAQDPARRRLGTGYTTWCLLSTSVVEVLDFRRGDGDDDDAGGTRHLSVSFFPPGAEDALRAGAS